MEADTLITALRAGDLKNPFARSDAFHRLFQFRDNDGRRFRVQSIASAIGRAPDFVSRHLALQNFDSLERTRVEGLTISILYLLGRIKNPTQRKEASDLILRTAPCSFRRAQKVIASILSPRAGYELPTSADERLLRFNDLRAARLKFDAYGRTAFLRKIAFYLTQTIDGIAPRLWTGYELPARRCDAHEALSNWSDSRLTVFIAEVLATAGGRDYSVDSRDWFALLDLMRV